VKRLAERPFTAYSHLAAVVAVRLVGGDSSASSRYIRSRIAHARAGRGGSEGTKPHGASYEGQGVVSPANRVSPWPPFRKGAARGPADVPGRGRKRESRMHASGKLSRSQKTWTCRPWIPDERDKQSLPRTEIQTLSLSPPAQCSTAQRSRAQLSSGNGDIGQKIRASAAFLRPSPTGTLPARAVCVCRGG
jgi:hypothetical protein